MKRRTVKASELRAGQAFFIGYIDFRCGWAPCVVVDEHLVTSWRGHWPGENERYPYRLHPRLVAHIGDHIPLWRTRRDARRYAEQGLKIYTMEARAK